MASFLSHRDLMFASFFGFIEGKTINHDALFRFKKKNTVCYANLMKLNTLNAISIFVLSAFFIRWMRYIFAPLWYNHQEDNLTNLHYKFINNMHGSLRKRWLGSYVILIVLTGTVSSGNVRFLTFFCSFCKLNSRDLFQHPLSINKCIDIPSPVVWLW